MAERPCILCKEPTTRRSGRCDLCVGVRAGIGESVVHPSTEYSEDPAAQMITSMPEGATLEQIGEAIGCTRERVRQIEVSALKKLRKRVAEFGLTDADLFTSHASTDRHVAPAPPSAPREAVARDDELVRGSVAWSRASSATGRGDARTSPLLEELYSPEGLRLAEATLELEQRAARVAALVARMPPEDPRRIPPTADGSQRDPGALNPGRRERTDDMAAAITWNGQTKSAKAWAVEYGVTVSAIYARIKRGANVDGTEPEAPAELDEEPSVEAAPEEAESSEVEELDEEAAEVEHDASDEIRPSILDLLERAGFEGVEVVSRNARGSLLWVPASA